MAKRMLIIGDLHLPVVHKKYFNFIKKVRKKWRTNKTMFIGDVFDWHGISFHTKHPNSPGPKNEYLLARKMAKKWHDAFPGAYVCKGNHDELPSRQAETAGVPNVCIKDYNELWGTPTWKWGYEFEIEDVYYFHGYRQGGIYPAYNAMKKKQMSVVMGHCHSRAGIKYQATPNRLTFAMDVGCGIDRNAWAMAYGSHMIEKPVLSCGVIINGLPYMELMKL